MKKKERLVVKSEIESLFKEYKEKFPNSGFEAVEERARIYFRFTDLNGAGIGFDISNKERSVLLSFFGSTKEFKGYSSSYFGKDAVNQFHFKKATKFCWPENIVDELRKYFEAIYTGEALLS